MDNELRDRLASGRGARKLGADQEFGEFVSPDQVLTSPGLSDEEKIVILEKWERALSGSADPSALVRAEDVKAALGELKPAGPARTGLAGGRQG